MGWQEGAQAQCGCHIWGVKGPQAGPGQDEDKEPPPVSCAPGLTVSSSQGSWLLSAQPGPGPRLWRGCGASSYDRFMSPL